jgi:hypothetical protein
LGTDRRRLGSPIQLISAVADKELQRGHVFAEIGHNSASPISGIVPTWLMVRQLLLENKLQVSYFGDDVNDWCVLRLSQEVRHKARLSVAPFFVR